MRLFIVLSVMAIAFTVIGCRSHKDVTVKGVEKVAYKIPVPEYSSTFLVPDSLLAKKKMFKFENERQRVSAIPDLAGYNFRFDCKADTLTDTLYVPYKVIVKSKPIVEYRDHPVWHYTWFWLLIAIIIILLLLRIL